MNIVNPIKDIEKINQVKAVLKADSARNCFLFELGINTGLRISDLLKLKVSDVKGSHIIITEQKTGKLKRFFINSALRSRIDEYIGSMSDDSLLFVLVLTCDL